ncbi:nitroreductase/quinone reductase family protein [Nocardioides guangzhouensis]|uniref:nitroreductase/quinone reductase family protein n=1 Tax=Nocardioides guangzhouensis TaxID=2497878 RepID=UPI00143859CB
MHRIDRLVFRLSGGRRTASAIPSGLPVIMLTTTGARTGLPRTVPVLGFAVVDDIAVAPGNFGKAADPGWCHNLRREPRAHHGRWGTVLAGCRRTRGRGAPGRLADRLEGLPGRLGLRKASWYSNDRRLPAPDGITMRPRAGGSRSLRPHRPREVCADSCQHSPSSSAHHAWSGCGTCARRRPARGDGAGGTTCQAGPTV